jgi:hypothetical protein
MSALADGLKLAKPARQALLEMAMAWKQLADACAGKR